jgi:uncharacterized protein (TIGR02145 family)
MSFKCNIGFHSWDGCKCSACGKIRDTEHEVSEDCGKCSRCGRTFDEEAHDWTSDCDKCSVCGKTRNNQHSWLKDCEKCSKCGKIQTNKHRFEGGICQICGNGTFHDVNDGSVYRVKKIGDQIIMAENFAKKPAKGNFWAYDDDESNLLKYGYLYDWEAAKNLAPQGWHLPSNAEWEALLSFISTEDKKPYELLKSGGDSGFESLFGGERYSRGAYNNLAASANYWSDTSENEEQVWQFKIGAYTETAELEKVDPNFGLSVRLFRNK